MDETDKTRPTHLEEWPLAAHSAKLLRQGKGAVSAAKAVETRRAQAVSYRVLLAANLNCLPRADAVVVVAFSKYARAAPMLRGGAHGRISPAGPASQASERPQRKTGKRAGRG